MDPQGEQVLPLQPPLLDSNDEEIIQSVVAGRIPSYVLESKLNDCRRIAGIRREALRRTTRRSLEGLPLNGFDYKSILGQCCELWVGYVTLPMGVAGPRYYVPMDTTEGCLVASTNRGRNATIKEDVVTKVLKTTASALVELNTIKNLRRSTIAGSLGGFNAIKAILHSKL